MVDGADVGTFCGPCGAQLEEPSSTPSGARTPCPSCGSLARHHKVKMAGGLPAPHSQLRLKAKRGGKGKPFLTQVMGDELYRDTQEWRRVERVIDRENDRYTERITRSGSGEIIKEVSESLSEHQGHGAAKRNRHQDIPPEEESSQA